MNFDIVHAIGVQKQAYCSVIFIGYLQTSTSLSLLEVRFCGQRSVGEWVAAVEHSGRMVDVENNLYVEGRSWTQVLGVIEMAEPRGGGDGYGDLR